jgi:hypothetical protein
MQNEENIDRHIPVPGSGNRHSDVSTRTCLTATYPGTSVQSTPAFADPTSLPPSVQAAWIAHLHGTPMQRAVAYIEDPLFNQLFPAVPDNPIQLQGGAIVGPSSGALLSMHANYREPYMAMTVAPPPEPATPPHGSDYMTSSYA